MAHGFPNGVFRRQHTGVPGFLPQAEQPPHGDVDPSPGQLLCLKGGRKQLQDIPVHRYGLAR